MKGRPQDGQDKKADNSPHTIVNTLTVEIKKTKQLTKIKNDKNCLAQVKSKNLSVLQVQVVYLHEYDKFFEKCHNYPRVENNKHHPSLQGDSIMLGV